MALGVSNYIERLFDNLARPRNQEETYFQKVADIIVREGKSFRQAAMELGLALTSEECNHIEKLKAFQRVLYTERLRYFTELAQNPERSKAAMIGQMYFFAQRLAEEGQWDKAAEVLLKAAKIEGFLGADNQVNIFGNLTPKDLEAAKAKIAERLANRIPTQEPGNA